MHDRKKIVAYIDEKWQGGNRMSENEIALTGESNLMAQSELYEPLTYYGTRPNISIAYVSDIHLLHHIRFFDGNIHDTVKAVTKSLWKSLCDFHSPSLPWSLSRDMPIFLGDVSSSKDVTVEFFRQYRRNAVYAGGKR